MVRTAVAAVAGAVATTALLAGCGADAPSARADGEHACTVPRGKGPAEPEVRPVMADTHTGFPGRLARRVDLDALERRALAGPSREEAEQLALLFTQAVLDSRDRVDAQRLVDDFTSDELPRAACQYVLGRLPAMRRIGWGLYVDPDVQAWVRSRGVGDTAAPSRVELDLVLTVDLENDPELFSVEGEPMVARVRVDVVRQHDAWLVAGWGGPDATALEPGERPTKKWYGDGWRAWEPGVRTGW